MVFEIVFIYNGCDLLLFRLQQTLQELFTIFTLEIKIFPVSSFSLCVSYFAFILKAVFVVYFRLGSGWIHMHIIRDRLSKFLCL